jgi:hypothetical protein
VVDALVARALSIPVGWDLRCELWRVRQSGARADHAVCRGVSSATISGLDTWAIRPTTGNPSIGTAVVRWQIPDYYRTHSPLTYVADIHAPLLILHGEEDTAAR